MNKIVFVILQAALQMAGSTSLRLIKPNVVALEVSNLSSFAVLLHCGEQYGVEEIYWERNGESISQTGNLITVIIDGLHGGNFTCHRPNRDLLNYTLLLVHPVEFPKGVLIQSSDREFISCTARNYNGQFHCSWKWHQERIQRAVVYFTAIRNSSPINCTLHSDISGLTCIDTDYCRYSEESRSINLTLFIRNLYRLEEHHRTFLIRDIVKPDKVSITKIQDDVFEWHPPETWSFPCSFFPLSYEVKVVPNNHSCDYTGSRVEKNETNETHYKVKFKKAYTFCVRAQDPLTKKVWGDWSHHQQRKHRHTSEK
ncbi:interleukin-12 subunit beta-like [Sinocyclocheilus rhinocerous]|uniref:Interleukin-12 subunit beta n=1 Tax=Sinocyclocheilus rhinocerous TaxID=307959 RepID=A0A673NF62_9TELE|nr:PREDICTED: interleukin-12 subunit beta-like [Sinocyclocheilus rhinocerous]